MRMLPLAVSEDRGDARPQRGREVTGSPAADPPSPSNWSEEQELGPAPADGDTEPNMIPVCVPVPAL